MTPVATESPIAGDMSSPSRGERIVMLCAGALFFLMLYAPTLFTAIKIALLATCGLAASWSLWNRRGTWAVEARLAIPVGIVALTGVAYMTYGWLVHTPGALPVARVYVGWVLVFGFLACSLTNWSQIVVLTRSLLAASIAAPAYGIVYILSGSGILPDWVAQLPLNGRQIYVQPGGQPLPTASFTFLATLLFTLPFCLAAFASNAPSVRRVAPRWVWLVACLLGFTVAVLSGRRALLLALAVTPIVWLVFGRMATGKWLSGASFLQVVRRGLTFALLSLLLLGAFVESRSFQYDAAAVSAGTRLLPAPAAAGGPSPVAPSAPSQAGPPASGGGPVRVTDRFTSGFDATNSADAQARLTQAKVLWSAFLAAPIVGHGLGASTPGYSRNDTQPWAYELSYLVWLFNMGIVGTAIYVAALLAIYVAMARRARRFPDQAAFLVAAAVGLSGFLVGNATNPYMGKFDGIWPMFFCLALLQVLNRMGASGGKPEAATPLATSADRHT